MKPASCFVFAALVGLLSTARADFTDSFNGTTLDASHWTSSNFASDSSVAVANGNLILTNRGRILTNDEFSRTTDMLLAFQFTGSQNDSFRIVLRTNGASTNPSGEFDNGIYASFRMQSDPGDPAGTTDNVSLFDSNGDILGLGTFGMVLNTTYLVRILDDGSTVSLFINNIATPFLTASDTDSYGNQIGFYNREGAGAGSFISAGSQVSVDFFSVTSSQVPEGGMTGLYLGLGLFGLMFVKLKSARAE